VSQIIKGSSDPVILKLAINKLERRNIHVSFLTKYLTNVGHVDLGQFNEWLGSMSLNEISIELVNEKILNQALQLKDLSILKKIAAHPMITPAMRCQIVSAADGELLVTLLKQSPDLLATFPNDVPVTLLEDKILNQDACFTETKILMKILACTEITITMLQKIAEKATAVDVLQSSFEKLLNKNATIKIAWLEKWAKQYYSPGDPLSLNDFKKFLGARSLTEMSLNFIETTLLSAVFASPYPDMDLLNKIIAIENLQLSTLERIAGEVNNFSILKKIAEDPRITPAIRCQIASKADSELLVTLLKQSPDDKELLQKILGNCHITPDIRHLVGLNLPEAWPEMKNLQTFYAHHAFFINASSRIFSNKTREDTSNIIKTLMTRALLNPGGASSITLDNFNIPYKKGTDNVLLAMELAIKAVGSEEKRKRLIEAKVAFEKKPSFEEFQAFHDIAATQRHAIFDFFFKKSSAKPNSLTVFLNALSDKTRTKYMDMKN